MGVIGSYCYATTSFHRVEMGLRNLWAWIKIQPETLESVFPGYLNFPINFFNRTKISLTQHDEICQNPASKGASQKIQASINFAFASVAQLMRITLIRTEFLITKYM